MSHCHASHVEGATAPSAAHCCRAIPRSDGLGHLELDQTALAVELAKARGELVTRHRLGIDLDVNLSLSQRLHAPSRGHDHETTTGEVDSIISWGCDIYSDR